MGEGGQRVRNREDGGLSLELRLPLLFALLFGRVFCAAVCPLGAMQDVFVVKPLKLPPWLEQALGLLPYVYLGLAVLFAATGAGFVICRFDPFVSFFRLSGNVYILGLGACFLLVGMFIARMQRAANPSPRPHR